MQQATRPGGAFDVCYEARTMLRLEFETTIIHWRGPAPFRFAPVPVQYVTRLAEAARQVTYGWGMIPVKARIRDVDFVTSLYPKDGGYLLPIKDAVRKDCGITVGDSIAIAVTVAASGR